MFVESLSHFNITQTDYEKVHSLIIWICSMPFTMHNNNIYCVDKKNQLDVTFCIL